MIDYDGFPVLVAEIMSQGFDKEIAAEYAALLGDTPVEDENGSVLVMDGERILATLKPLKFYGDGH
jgi:hypothetical protein